jgi:hypothetical protein
MVPLQWSPWVSFDTASFSALPAGPGVYRVRVIGHAALAYIGQTGRDLRARLRDLRRNTLSQLMPFNDPHTAAPSLWAWGDAEGYQFECSAAPVDLDTRSRLGLEAWLLWQHRLELGSTLCNFGRFHPHYVKSGDRKTQRRGGRLGHCAVNPAGGPTSTPLRIHGDVRSRGWMGLPWGPWTPLHEAVVAGPGLYRIAGDGDGLLYVGESKDVGKRLRTHRARDWGTAPLVSVWSAPTDTRKHQLHELETDLIGAHVHVSGAPPAFQFGV